MRHLRLWLVVLVLGLWAWPSSFGQASMSKEDKVKKLMELTGAGQIGIQMMQQMMASLEESMPGIPSGFAPEFQKEFNPDSLTAMITPIYAKYFTEKELDDIITFYQTSTGKKLIAVMPEALREIQEAGKQWGQRVGQRVMEKLKEKWK